MAQFDSDSSDGEISDYTETNVLLGFASKETSDDIVSHLGGEPQWIESNIPPSTSLVKCKVCNNFMVLLLQLNGCLPEYFPEHVRRLYIWICRRKSCKRKNGSVRALRGVQVLDNVAKDGEPKLVEEESSSKEKSSINLGEVLFTSKPQLNTDSCRFPNKDKASNPFAPHNSNPLNSVGTAITHKQPLTSYVAAAPPSPSTTTNLSKTFAQSLSLNIKTTTKVKSQVPPETWPQESELPPAFPILYLIDIDYETLDIEKKCTADPTQAMLLDDEKSYGNSKEDKIVFESSIDQTFQKFADRMGQNPEHVIRYEFMGQPLLYSKNDKVGRTFSNGGRENSKISTSSGNAGSNRIPRCENCGATRVFELQLTPHAITDLEREEESIDDGMEWGTIILCVCRNDCQQNGIYNGLGYVEEWVGVQWEELK